MILQAGQQVNPHIKVLSVENNNIKRRVKEAIVDHCYQTKKPFLNSMNRDEGLDLLASYNHLSGIRRLSYGAIRNNFCVTQPDTSQS